MSALTLPLSSVMSPVCLFLWVFYLFKVSLAKGLSLWFTSKELHCIDLGRGYFLASVLFAPSLIFIISSITEALAFASPIVLVLWHGGRCFNAFGFFRACPDCQQLPSWWFIHHTFSWVVCVDRFILVSFSVSSLIQKYAVQFPCLCVVFRAVFFLPNFQLSCIVVGKDTWSDCSFWKICWDLVCGLSYDLSWGLFHVLIENVHPPTVEQRVLWCCLARCFIGDASIPESGVWKLNCYCLLISGLHIWVIEDLSHFLSKGN